MKQTTLTDTEFADTIEPGRAGPHHIPEEYRSINGWEHKSHNYVLKNVAEFWGASHHVEGIVIWKASRFGFPIADLALVGTNPDENGDLKWQLRRETHLGKSPRRPYKSPDGEHAVNIVERGLENALEAAKEWMKGNPSKTAYDTIVSPDLPTHDPVERFNHYLRERIRARPFYEVRTDPENVVGLFKDGEELPQSLTWDDMGTPVESVERSDAEGVGYEIDLFAVDGVQTAATIYVEGVSMMLRCESVGELADKMSVHRESGLISVNVPNTEYVVVLAPTVHDDVA